VSIYAALTGTVGNAELKTAKTGREYLQLSVKSDEAEGTGNWVTVSVFDAEAIEQADRFTKGTVVTVEGKLDAGIWTGHSDGKPRLQLSMMANFIRIAQIGRDKPEQSAAPRRDGPPAQGNARAQRPMRDELSDDIPF
jgi:single-stranded DNA-binding protein